MKRSGIQRKTPLSRSLEFADWKRPQCSPLVLPENPPPRRVIAMRFTFNPQPKDDELHHEGYRRLVAALPCIRCRIEGYSQAAHPNVGKAKGAKADDRECFPLCCTRPLIVGCHYMHDQHKLFARGERRGTEQQWGATTRGVIVSAGLWPEDLPRWEPRLAVADEVRA